MYSCKLCAYKPRDNSALREHTQRIHFQCQDCQLSHKNQEDILKHLKEKHGFDFSCEPCQKRFFAKRELKKHNMKRHGKVQNKENLHPCTQSNFQAKSLTYLKNHFNAVHRVLINDRSTEDQEERVNGDVMISVFLSNTKENYFEDDEPMLDPLDLDIRHIKKEVDYEVKSEITKNISIESSNELKNDVIVETTEFQCSKCDFEGNNTEDLEKHINQRHKVANPFFMANTSVKTSRVLENHTVAEKSKIDVLACDLCNFIGDRESSLKIHMDAVHLKQKNFKCENCDFATGWPKSLTAHKMKCLLAKTVHKRNFSPGRDNSDDSDNKRRRLACDLCGYIGRKPRELEEHKKAKHLKIKDLNDLKCSQCSFTTSWTRNLKVHMKKVHGDKIKCQNCDYTNWSKKSMDKHLKYCSPTAKMFQCNKCDYKVSNLQVLNSHRSNLHRKIYETVGNCIKCDFCDYSSKDRYHVNRHTKSCGPKVNMFTCKKGNCNFTVSNTVALSKHKARCEKDKDSELPIIVNVESGRELACELCDHVAFTKLSLRAHLKVMHKDECKSTQSREDEPMELNDLQEMPQTKKGKWVVLLKKLRLQ